MFSQCRIHLRDALVNLERFLSAISLTWSRNPIPVETSMFCFTPDPGAQSRSIVTSISVSLVLREMVACLADIVENESGN